MKTFTINQLITSFETLNVLKPNEIWKVELGIRCARSYHCLYKTKPDRTEETLTNGKVIMVNNYPESFMPRVHKIIKDYLKAVSKGKLITTVQYNKKKKENDKNN